MNELRGLPSSGMELPAGAVRAIARFVSLVQTAGGLLAASNIEQALLLCATLPSWKNDCGASPEAAGIRDRLFRIARSSGSYRAFMDAVFLQREEDGVWSRAEAVSLATIHASKGLEWPAVFIIGCEDGLIPLSADRGAGDPAEERRLLYVGMSRAKELLYLTYAKYRFSRGGRDPRLPSPFLADIPDDAKSAPDCSTTKKPRRKPNAEQVSLF